jgi:hypothetical protein
MKRSQKICLSPAAAGRVIFWQRNEVNFSQLLNRLDFFVLGACPALDAGCQDKKNI